MSSNIVSSTDPKALVEEKGDAKDTDLTSRELFWDKAVLFLATLIVALGAVDVFVEALRGGSAAVCFVDEEFNATRSQDLFIQNYCSRRVRKIQHLSIFAFFQGLSIGVIHYLWKSSFNNNFNYFFTLVKSLSRFKEKDTGEYPYQNLAIVKKLQLEFYVFGRRKVLIWYTIKLVVQAIAVLIVLFATGGYFREEFVSSFECPGKGDNISAWPYANMTVTCIALSTQAYHLTWIVDLTLLCLMAVLLLWGLLWVLIWPHPKQLNSKQAALFAFTTGMDPAFYVPKSRLRYLSYMILNCVCKKCRKKETKPVPNISTDLEFFLMLLYRTDSSLGHAFYEGQVSLEHKALQEKDEFLISSCKRGMSAGVHVWSNENWFISLSQLKSFDPGGEHYRFWAVYRKPFIVVGS